MFAFCSDASSKRFEAHYRFGTSIFLSAAEHCHGLKLRGEGVTGLVAWDP